MSTTTATLEEDRALKARHAVMWALGDYDAVATEVVQDLGPRLVTAAGVRAGDRVLDVAAGTGNAALPAAASGAAVTACDLTPELIEAGRRHAARRQLSVDWRVGDAEDLPFEDGMFDVVLSCVGVMFAPHHQPAADELVRVTRPGGSLALLSWTAQGFIGQMFATMKPYAPPPPPGAQPPPLWGEEAHVSALLGERVTGLRTARRSLRVDGFGQPGSFRTYFKAHYGPTIAVYRTLDEERAARLDAELDALAARSTDPTGAMEWEYLLVTARRR